MSGLDDLVMQSNVARDVLNTALQFGSVQKMLPEYVTNATDNPNDDHPVVRVEIIKRSQPQGRHRIIVRDNARGMDTEGLRLFFTMHAENRARRRGQRARGRFGTGKAAAFGVGAAALQLTTCRNGLRSEVRLERTELEAAAREERLPQPTVLVADEPTDEPNGTEVVIDGVDKPVNVDRIASELRRTLGRHLDRHEIVLFGERVLSQEPQVQMSREFRSVDLLDIAAVVGDITCTVKVASSTISDETMRGILVTSGEFPVGQVVAVGEHGSRLFGTCEVPSLDTDTSTPGPFSDARDLRLNEDNRVAGPLVAWVRECMQEVSDDLRREERDRRRRARDEQLHRAATRMEDVLNEHYRGEFRRSRANHGDLGPGQGTTRPVAGISTPDPDGSHVVPDPIGRAGYSPTAADTTTPTTPTPTPTPLPDDDESPTPRTGQAHERDPLGEGRGNAVSPEASLRRQRRRRGGFAIEFEELGAEAPRSEYRDETLTIVLNLDHPEFKAAHAGGDNPMFRMLAFEVAAQEYAFAVAYQLIEEDESLDAFDILQEVRRFMNELTRNVASIVEDLVGLTAT